MGSGPAPSSNTCIARAIRQGDLHREPEWTEGLAGGSERYVQEVGKMIDHRMSVNIEPVKGEGNTWVVRETPETDDAGPYSAFWTPKSRAKGSLKNNFTDSRRRDRVVPERS